MSTSWGPGSRRSKVNGSSLEAGLLAAYPLVGSMGDLVKEGRALLYGRHAALHVMDGLSIGRATFLGGRGIAFIFLEAQPMRFLHLREFFLDVRIPLDRPELFIVLAAGQSTQHQDETHQQSCTHAALPFPTRFLSR